MDARWGDRRPAADPPVSGKGGARGGRRAGGRRSPVGPPVARRPTSSSCRIQAEQAPNPQSRITLSDKRNQARNSQRSTWVEPSPVRHGLDPPGSGHPWLRSSRPAVFGLLHDRFGDERPAALIAGLYHHLGTTTDARRPTSRAVDPFMSGARRALPLRDRRIGLPDERGRQPHADDRRSRAASGGRGEACAGRPVIARRRIPPTGSTPFAVWKPSRGFTWG